MQIDRIYYPVLTLGVGRRVGIWTLGCPHACPACANPELWQPDQHRDLPVPEIMQMISAIKQRIDGVTITGGEPFVQIPDLEELVTAIRSTLTQDIMIYTGFTLSALRQMADERVNNILNQIAVLIDGPYVDEQNDGLGLRGSNNQKVHIFNPLFEDRRSALEQGTRQVQNIFYGHSVFSIGIPPRNFRENIQHKLSAYGIENADNNRRF
ncbi:MAG: radical SAM protein [Syntrophomonadaceae bacterium]|nr:radical SAM protein [Syntrophomonadaceae bacterium]